MSSCSFDLSSSRMTTFSPNCVGTDETRRSRSRERSSTRSRILMRPSWGSRFSEMSSFAMILRREMSGSRVRIGSAMMLCRMPSTRNRTRNSFSYGSTWMSDAPAFSASMRIRLDTLMIGADSRGLREVGEVDLLALLAPDDVDVGAGVHAGDLVHVELAEADARHVVHRERRGRHDVVETAAALAGLVVPAAARLRLLLEDDRARSPVVLVDRLAQRDLARDHRLDVVAGHELDVVHGEDVGRIAHRDRQRRAGLVHRQDAVLAGDLAGHDLDDAGVDLEVREVDGRDAELLRQRLRDVRLGDRADANERLADLAALLALELQRGLELLLRDELLLEEEVPEFYGHGMKAMVGV